MARAPDTGFPAETLLDSLTTAVLWLDGSQRLRYLNPAAQDLLALSPRTALGAALGEILPQARTFHHGLQAAREQAQPYTHRELVLVVGLDPPHVVTVDCTITPLDATGELLVELVPLDRHLLISREEALVAQQQTRRALVQGLAHEIKNPLGGLRGAAQLLQRSLANPALAEYTDIIIREADRLRSLVDTLLGPGRAPRFRPTNIHELLEHVAALAVAEAPKTLRLQRDYDPSIPEVQADPDQLIQVLLNLLRNAVQALNGHGTVLLRTRTLRQYTIGHTRHRLVLRVDVEDGGPGIPPALQERLFFPLVSGRAEGTGLGLSIAQDIVVRHRGLIECESRPGRTVFSVVLPLENKP